MIDDEIVRSTVLGRLDAFEMVLLQSAR